MQTSDAGLHASSSWHGSKLKHHACPPPPPQALTNGLTHALHALLLLGPARPEAQAAASAALGRCGAEVLREEVAALAGRLAEVAAVGEAVYEPWYQALSADLL